METQPGADERVNLEPLTDNEIEALAYERLTLDESQVEQAHRYFANALVPAVKSLCDIAIYSQSERLRLQAATYVVERNLGRLTDKGQDEAQDPFLKLLADCVSNDPTTQSEGEQTDNA